LRGTNDRTPLVLTPSATVMVISRVVLQVILGMAFRITGSVVRIVACLVTRIVALLVTGMVTGIVAVHVARIVA